METHRRNIIHIKVDNSKETNPERTTEQTTVNEKPDVELPKQPEVTTVIQPTEKDTRKEQTDFEEKVELKETDDSYPTNRKGYKKGTNRFRRESRIERNRSRNKHILF
ncbi:hypothetical protein QE152_g31031 [Popillia japonica]|uniref:Uncharacterized protein n=1 Tax=Popillia japonica TaxID=7064 RepID=A0AAW1JCB3_POPJA